MANSTGNAQRLAAEDKLFGDSQSVGRQDDQLQEDYSTLQVMKRIWSEHLLPRYKLVLVAVSAMIVSASTTGITALLIKYVIDEVYDKQDQSLVIPVAIAIIVVTLLKTGSEYLSNVAVQYLGNRFIADMRVAMFQQLVRADLRWLEDVHSGRFVSGFLTDAALLHQTASKAMLAIGENLLKVVVLIGVMVYLNWQLSLIILACMPFGMFLLGKQRKKMGKSTKKTLQETGDLSALISQTLRSIRVVRAFRQDDKEISRARETINRAMEFSMRGARAKASATPIAELLTGLGFAFVVFYAGTQDLSQTEMTKGDFAGFMASAMLIFQPLRALASLQTNLAEGVAAASRVFGIIDRKTELVEAPGAAALKVTDGQIDLANVTFAYEAGKPVLQDLTLHVPAGKTVALVGASGAGKSTILNLVLRFFDPSSGQVLIDGQDISKVTFDSLREATALVTQEPILFDDTIEANIAYGNKSASKEDIIAAAKVAQAHDFITKMPKGYQTSAREAGNALSGGERQRIAIARAVLADAPILLLDEPTSSLDSQSEAKVQEALNQLMAERTVLMIAHRLSTVKNADVICVLDRGALIEMGGHEELIAKNGAYAQLCRTQFQGEG